VYRRIYEDFRTRHGEKPVDRLPREWIVKELNERSTKPAAANIWLKRIRQLLDHAVDLGMINDNPARKVRLIRHRHDGFADWPEEQISQYESYWKIGTRERLAFDLLLFSGQRRSDVVRMARSNIRNDAIRVVQIKTGTQLWIPIHPALRVSIDLTPTSGLYFVQTAHGRPYTSAGFGNAFRNWCNAAGVEKQYSAHGLRKSAARRLAEAGASAHQIAAITGHKTLAEVARYTAAADQLRNAEAAIAKVRTGREPNLSSGEISVSSKEASG
jgi:integrase